MADPVPLCADCNHVQGLHSPCSACSGEGRNCRDWVEKKTERHGSDGKRKGKSKASKRRKP